MNFTITCMNCGNACKKATFYKGIDRAFLYRDTQRQEIRITLSPSVICEDQRQQCPCESSRHCEITRPHDISQSLDVSYMFEVQGLSNMFIIELNFSIIHVSCIRNCSNIHWRRSLFRTHLLHF